MFAQLRYSTNKNVIHVHPTIKLLRDMPTSITLLNSIHYCHVEPLLCAPQFECLSTNWIFHQDNIFRHKSLNKSNFSPAKISPVRISLNESNLSPPKAIIVPNYTITQQIKLLASKDLVGINVTQWIKPFAPQSKYCSKLINVIGLSTNILLSLSTCSPP